jgi:hypothetical protein
MRESIAARLDEPDYNLENSMKSRIHRTPPLLFAASALSLTAMLSLLVPSVHAADPGFVCGAAVAKSMASCIKKVVKSEVVCFKKTGVGCADDDEKIAKALGKTRTAVLKKCRESTSSAAAGYGEVRGSDLGDHFEPLCERLSRAMVDDSFGRNGATFIGGDEVTQDCLLNVGKQAAGHVGKGLKALAKCVGKSCAAIDVAADAAALSAKTTANIDKKCEGVAVVGSEFVDRWDVHIVDGVAGPCDSMDASNCAFPFPNDYFSNSSTTTASGRRISLGSASMARTRFNHPFEPGPWNKADGFSIGAMMLFGNEDLDLVVTGAAPITDLAESLASDTPILLVDAETGDQQLIWVERDERGATTADQAIIGRVGKNLKNGHRYIVAVRNLKDAGDQALAASTIFAALRDGTPTDLLPVEARRAHMEDVFTTLEGFGIARNELYLAWDFTTQSADSTSKRLLAMRDDAFDNILGAGAPSFTVDTVDELFNANIFRRVIGTFEVPLYLNTNGDPGSSLREDSDGIPYNEGDTFTANYMCVIPNAATTAGGAPAIPARPSLYGHGLLGDFGQTDSGHVMDFADEHNLIFCGTDWTGFADEDALFALEVVANFSKFPRFIDRQHQGILNFQFLGRLLTHASGFSSDAAFQVGGQSMIDTSNLYYDGNSQGGILGGVLAAVSQDIERFSLGVPGMNYSTLLNRSVDFTAFADPFAVTYASSLDRSALLSASQILWDRTDPSGHANHVTSDPYAGTSAKKLLYQVAFGDHQVAPVTAEIAARTVGASIHAPTLDGAKVVPELVPYYDIPAIPSYPFDGSALIIWDSGNPPTPLGNVPPDPILPSDPEWGDLEACAMSGSSDPHSCPRKHPAARTQKSEFLKPTGAVIDVCGGAACVAP